MKCDPTTSAKAPVEWSGPDTTSMCYIGGKCMDDGTHRSMGRSVDPSMKCDVASSTSAYTVIKGYLVSLTLPSTPSTPA